MKYTLLSAVAVLVLFACASGDLIEQPKELPENRPKKVSLDIRWWKILGDERARNAFGQLVPTIFKKQAFVALSDGSVFRVDEAGKATKLGQHSEGVTAPLGVDEDDMFLLDSEGSLTDYNLNFEPRWSLSLNALSLEKPIITDSRIFVQTIDGRVNAIERITGRLLWVYQDAEPDLTVTGTGSPLVIDTNDGQAVVTGLANGKLVALNVVNGSVIWEYRIAKASGRTDVSRLVDVDARVTSVGNRLVISGYQGDLVVIDSFTGRVLQAKEFSSYRSILAKDNTWFGVSADSHLIALNPSTLEVVWENDDFEYRQISEMLYLNPYLIAADADGYMHVLDSTTGEWLGSRQIDPRGAKTDPVAFADGVLMQGSSSRLKLIDIHTR